MDVLLRYMLSSSAHLIRHYYSDSDVLWKG